jgi:pentatricopeptide repeat protein
VHLTLRGAPAPCVPQVTFTTLIDGCVRAGDVGAARGLLLEMRSAGVAPNVVTFNALLRGQLETVMQTDGHSREHIFELLREMGDAGVKPNTGEMGGSSAGIGGCLG